MVFFGARQVQNTQRRAPRFNYPLPSRPGPGSAPRHRKVIGYPEVADVHTKKPAHKRKAQADMDCALACEVESVTGMQRLARCKLVTGTPGLPRSPGMCEGGALEAGRLTKGCNLKGEGNSRVCQGHGETCSEKRYSFQTVMPSTACSILFLRQICCVFLIPKYERAQK